VHVRASARDRNKQGLGRNFPTLLSETRPKWQKSPKKPKPFNFFWKKNSL